MRLGRCVACPAIYSPFAEGSPISASVDTTNLADSIIVAHSLLRVGRYDMPARSWHSLRLIIVMLILLSRVPHQFVETLPQGRNGVVFLGHAEDFFELAVEAVGG